MSSVKTSLQALFATSFLLSYAFASLDFSQLLPLRGLGVDHLDDKNDTRKPLTSCTSTSCFRYYNNETAPYLITQWPDVPYDTGEFYAGSIAIPGRNASLYFVFQPAMDEPVDEITIWLNGGPG